VKVFVDASLVVYLNVKMPVEEAELVERFWLELLKEHELYTNVLALDEAIYVSQRKYGVPFADTLELVDRAVLPYVEVLAVGVREYLKAREFMLRHGLKPSDALHAATVVTHGLHAVASEDSDFDRVGVKRIWVQRP